MSKNHWLQKSSTLEIIHLQLMATFSAILRYLIEQSTGENKVKSLTSPELF